MSKGSGRRPRQVSREEYERRYALAFGGEPSRAYPSRGLARMHAEHLATHPESAKRLQDSQRRLAKALAAPVPDFLDGYKPAERP